MFYQNEVWYCPNCSGYKFYPNYDNVWINWLISEHYKLEKRVEELERDSQTNSGTITE